MCFYPPRLLALFSSFILAAPLGCGGALSLESPKIQTIAPDVAETLPVLLAFLAQDERCGTAIGPQDDFQPVITGLPGEKGDVLWQRESCRVQLPYPISLGHKCGEERFLSGAFTISFQKRESGWLTQNGNHRLLLDADSEAIFDIQLTNADILIGRGEASFALTAESLAWTTRMGSEPNDASMMCDTFSEDPRQGEARIRGLSYEGFDSNGSVRSKGLNFNFQSAWNAKNKSLSEVDGQWAQNGEWNDFRVSASWLQNQGAGCVDVRPNQPVNNTGAVCHYRDAHWAQDAIRTSFPMMQTLLTLLERNPACGFGSANVSDHPAITGEVGSTEGVVTYEIQAPCLIDLRDATPVEENCHGETTEVSGGIWVTGTKTTRGWVTGNPSQPVIPIGTQATTYHLELQFDDFHYETPHFPTITYRSGVLSGDIAPTFGLNQTTGICDAGTASLSMENMIWHDATISVHEAEGAFHTQFREAAFQGSRGATQKGTNSFHGSVRTSDSGNEIYLPLDDKRGHIDNRFLRFQDSAQCVPFVTYEPSEEQCDYLNVLAQKAGQAILESVAHATQYVQNDNLICGFSAPDVAGDAMETEGQPGEVGRRSWKTGACENNLDTLVVSEDCTGNQVLLAGGFEFQGQMLEEGLLVSDQEGSRLIAQEHDALTLEIGHLSFHDFELVSRASSAQEWILFDRFEIHHGELQGKYRPIRGANAEEAGQYDVHTPVAQFEKIDVQNTQLQLELNGNVFQMVVTEGMLGGTRGAFDGSANEIFGRLLINGRWVQLNHVPYDTSFEQESFDATYVCEPNLLDTIPKD